MKKTICSGSGVCACHRIASSPASGAATSSFALPERRVRQKRAARGSPILRQSGHLCQACGPQGAHLQPLGLRPAKPPAVIPDRVRRTAQIAAPRCLPGTPVPDLVFARQNRHPASCAALPLAAVASSPLQRRAAWARSPPETSTRSPAASRRRAISGGRSCKDEGRNQPHRQPRYSTISLALQSVATSSAWRASARCPATEASVSAVIPRGASVAVARRTRTRWNREFAFEGSSTQASPCPVSQSRSVPRPSLSSGRSQVTPMNCRRAAIAANPSTPAPRASRIRKVSARSSAVMPKRHRRQPVPPRPIGQQPIPRAPRLILQIAAADPSPASAAPHARTPRSAQSRATAAASAAVPSRKP